MGGGNIAGQFMKAGLIDEINIHLVPVLFGSGTPLFGHLICRSTRSETT